jgi:putative tricarboxylic transport membrane protein
MASVTTQKRKGYLVIGGAGVILAIVYLGLTTRLPFGTLAKPGAGLFPLVAGSTLLVASILALREGWAMGRELEVVFPAGEDRRRLVILVGALVAYVLLLPWLGQLVCSALLCMGLIRMLSSSLSWPRVVVAGLLMSAALYGVFVMALKVPMPRGVLFGA